jgi:hypothetical protein
MKANLYKHLCILVLSLGVLSGTALAQTATINGTVTDSSDAVIPGVSLTITNTDTNAARTVLSDDNGNYAAPLLSIGKYRIEGSIEGFNKEVVQDITLNVNETLRIDLKFKPGTIDETVEVTAAAGLIQSETATVGNVIDSQKVAEIPLNGRRFETMALLVPGVTTNNPSPSTGPLNFSASGGRFSSNNFMLDGVDNSDSSGGTSGFVLRPIVDAIQEFKVQTNSYSAEFGRGGGANIQVQTKSGTNAFHASVWDFLRNDALDARGFFENKKGEFRRNQFGGTAGGPIWRDRTFFFGAYEGIRRLQTRASLQAVPSTAFRRGDFSALSAPLRDAVNGGTFPNNQIPSSRWSPGALAILNYYPQPAPGLSAPLNFLAANIQTDNLDQWSGRLDHRISGSNTFSGRYSYSGDKTLNPCMGAVITACVPGFPTSVVTNTQQLSLLDTHIFTASVVNELRAGFSRTLNRNIATSSSALGGSNLGAALGIPGLPSSTNSLDWGMPTVSISGFGGLGSVGYNFRATTTYAVSDVLSYVNGSHSIRSGFEFRNQLFYAQGGRARDALTFDGRFTGNAFADFLLGFPSQTVQNPSDFPRYRHTKTFATFLQDDWNIRRNLTLNIGVRYDYTTPDVEKQDREVNINSKTYTVEIAGRNGASRALYEPDRKNVAPRIGFAYRPAKGFVIRGGYGIFFDVALQGSQLGGIRMGPPFTTNQTYNASNNPLDLTLSNPFPSGRLQASSIYDYRSIQTDFKNGYLQQWNLGIQKSVGNNMVLETGYIGSKGSRLYRLVDINQAFPGAGLVQSRRPLQQYGSVVMLQSQAASSYHALINRFERRFSGGLTFLTAYTWAHSIDTFSSAGISVVGGQNVRDLSSERASSDFDTRHRLVLSYVYELPFGRSRKFLGRLPPFAEILLGGWQISGITTVQSGNPVNVAIQGSGSNTGTINLDRPNATGIAPRLSASTNKTVYLNPAAYTLPAVGSFGNAARNSAIGPGIAMTDVSIAKKFTHESWLIEFRTELFNAFNHALLGQPVPFANSPTFGRIGATRGDNRQIQFGLKISR